MAFGLANDEHGHPPEPFAEAFAIAAGLWLGGKKPIVMLQNVTGIVRRMMRHPLMRWAVLASWAFVGWHLFDVQVRTDQLPEPVYGRVTHMTWRSTFLALDDGRRLMVPNHIVTANPVMNHSRPADAKRLYVVVAIDSRMPSDRVTDMLLGEAFKAARRPGLVPPPPLGLSRRHSPYELL